MKFAIFLLAASCFAQVSVKFTPEPMIVPTAALSNANDMGRWLIEGCNGATPVDLYWEQISMATDRIRFIGTDDVLLVLANHQGRTVAGTIVKVGTLAAQGIAIGLAVANGANRAWTTGLSLGSALAPMVIKAARDQVPSIAPLASTTKYPIHLEPGACFTDYRFAAKMRGARIEKAIISVDRPQARFDLSPTTSVERMAD